MDFGEAFALVHLLSASVVQLTRSEMPAVHFAQLEQPVAMLASSKTPEMRRAAQLFDEAVAVQYGLPHSGHGQRCTANVEFSLFAVSSRFLVFIAAL